MKQARAQMAVLYESTLDEDARVSGNPYIRKFKFEMEPAGAGLSVLRENFAKPFLALMAIVGLAAADRLRQRGQHVACPWCGATARNGGARFSRRWTLPPGSPGADGISASFCSGQPA